MSTKQLRIHKVKDRKEFEKVFSIRKIVFEKEQCVPTKINFDGKDKINNNIIVYFNEKPVGCVRIRILNKKAKLERLALLKKFRGKGLGNLILEYILMYCKKKEVNEITLHAQFFAKDFYLKKGFNIKGKPFFEANIKHIKMNMKL